MKFVLKRYLLVLSLLILLSSGFWILPVQAQTTAEGPVYIVQSGDTLTGIALRFGVTVADLVAANGLADANSLNIGDRLIIPGLTGISGVLETRTIAFGENLRSLSRKYAIPEAMLVKLNRIVSPAELVVGSPLVLPIQDGSQSGFIRLSLAPGESLLEAAVLANQSPWLVVAYNRLPSTASALPGDVLLVPGGDVAGPGALPGDIAETAVSRLGQGKTGVIRVNASRPITLSGSLGENQLHFFQAREGEYVALQGIYALQEPGMVPLLLQGVLSDGTPFSFTQMVYIDDRNYMFEYLSVPPSYIDPEVTASESAIVADLIAPFTPERYWQGVFIPPTPYGDCINSTFGNRRSYNGSAFNYFHGGVDFCGGTGTEIYAPAPGKVIFAGPMEIRGQYTLIDHGWGVYSGYMHQSEILVSPGDWVETGQVIGKVGSTGRSTGPHLHWEIWVGGQLVNPLDWISASYP